MNEVNVMGITLCWNSQNYDNFVVDEVVSEGWTQRRVYIQKFIKYLRISKSTHIDVMPLDLNQNGYGLEPKSLWTWAKIAMDLNQNGYRPEAKWLWTWPKTATDLNPNRYAHEPKWLWTWTKIATDLTQNNYGLEPKWLRTWPKTAPDLNQNGDGLGPEWLWAWTYTATKSRVCLPLRGSSHTLTECTVEFQPNVPRRSLKIWSGSWFQWIRLDPRAPSVVRGFCGLFQA